MDKLFFISIPKDFWHGIKGIGKNIISGKLYGYYSDLTLKTEPYFGKKSKEGFPLVYENSKKKYFLHPVTVCQVGLGWYDIWLSKKNELSRTNFLNCADWLVHNQKSHSKIQGIWIVPYEVPVYGLRENWISSLVQGQAISLLVRAYQDTSEEKYLNSANLALVSLLIDAENGGLHRLDSKGNIYFEEYPTLKPSRVLNGLIYTIWGLYDFLLINEDKNIKEIYNSSIQSFLDNIHHYDVGYWSKYYLYENANISQIASPYYHQEHISQLRAFNLIHENLLFSFYINKWVKYINFINLSRVIFKKSISRIYSRYINSK
jgi:hypothetical protein